MRVTGGFLAERRPGERGLAHLIEHLVFHSPTRAAPDELRRFRQVGFPLTLPQPAGGTTTWRESDYFVVSRTNKPADLNGLFGLYREVASDLTFRTDAVDAQRGEVMREMADKKLGNDIYARYIAAVAPGSPTDIIDAQNSDDVPTASVETIRNAYHRLYRPENTTLVVVGDVDAAEVAKLVETRFGDWHGIGPAARPAQIPGFQPDRVRPVSYSAQQYGRNTAMVTLAMPLLATPVSREAQARSSLMDMLAIRAVNSRLAASRADYPPGKYGAFIENGEQGHRLLMIWDDFVPGRWRPAVADLKRTACQLSTVGFSDVEWATARQSLLRELEARASDETRMPNFVRAKELADAITMRREVIPAGEFLRYAQARAASLDARTMNSWLHTQWQSGSRHLRVESPELASVRNPEAAIRSVLNRAAGAGCANRAL
jgi:zinc protease